MSAPPSGSLRIATIDCSRDDASATFATLRDKLSPRGDVVSEAGKRRTIEIFGQPLSPQQVVDGICRDVRERGLAAVLDYGRKLDKKDLTPETLRVQPSELEAAHAQADRKFLATLRRIRANITEFQQALLSRDAVVTRKTGAAQIELRQRYLPLRRVGICIPGGAAAYPSTLLMTAVPAQVAGVKEIAVAVPPTDFGGYNTDLLAACYELGITEIYRMGGAGRRRVGVWRRRDRAGRQNRRTGQSVRRTGKKTRLRRSRYRQHCRSQRSGRTRRRDARADFVASDLISQAEHSPGSGVLITWHAPLAAAVHAELDKQLARLERGDLARQSLEDYGALIIARDADEAARLADLLAPEHLHISTAQPEQLLAKIQNAGAIFLGHHTPVAVGDYVAGPSHVLPTGGTARFANGLCANDFLKRSSVIHYNRDALAAAADDIRLMAAKEGLTAHSGSVDIRLTE